MRTGGGGGKGGGGGGTAASATASASASISFCSCDGGGGGGGAVAVPADATAAAVRRGGGGHEAAGKELDPGGRWANPVAEQRGQKKTLHSVGAVPGDWLPAGSEWSSDSAAARSQLRMPAAAAGTQAPRGSWLRSCRPGWRPAAWPGGGPWPPPMPLHTASLPASCGAHVSALPEPSAQAAPVGCASGAGSGRALHGGP
mmetsp:Transcript_17267/g.51698  ORF Transcript_17267/g.51698 Transcript_17267/m.51698 type:complete len:200 (-) Transcript_17267:1036-1635(-)